MRIYEHKTFENFEEKDPNFNKIIVHIERLLKITTAQTLAIDSLERKIMNLSKRNLELKNELVIPNADNETVKDSASSVKERKSVGSQPKAPGEDGDVKFADMFPNIIEDEFESSDENDEKLKNERLERLGKIAAAAETQQTEEMKAQQAATTEEQKKKNQVMIGENGDILARYKIPVQDNIADYTLQLPEDKDSSDSTSDDEQAEMDDAKNADGEEAEAAEDGAGGAGDDDSG